MWHLSQVVADPTSVTAAVFTFAAVIAGGLAVGTVSVGGVRLGVAGVLFTALAAGHAGLTPAPAVLEFAREFGLALFVFIVGLSIGPGFFTAIRADGIRYNLLAIGVVIGGVAMTAGAAKLFSIPGPVAVGLLCGATTNTPSLAAAGQALRDYPPADSGAIDELTKLPGLGYALAYPGGVVGIIAALIILRRAFGIDIAREAAELRAQAERDRPKLMTLNLCVENPNLAGVTIEEIPAIEHLGVTVSRLHRAGVTTVARPDTRLATGDVLLAIGSAESLEQFRAIVGDRAAVDVAHLSSDLSTRWITVTRRSVVGRSVEDLDFARRHSVQLTRIRRADVELAAAGRQQLWMGDRVLAVGLTEPLAAVARECGDSPHRLEEPDLLPVFLGLVAGVILGTVPLSLPGVSSPVKLGLAGGPLLTAIVVGFVHRIGPLVWYLSPSAGSALRQLGIVLFLAAVGLKSGDRFVASLTSGDGLLWVGVGAAVTTVPLFVMAAVARLTGQAGFIPLTGILAGSMTDPPALAFAQAQSGGDAPALAYATVYPLTMILRILSAQLLILVLT